MLYSSAAVNNFDDFQPFIILNLLDLVGKNRVKRQHKGTCVHILAHKGDNIILDNFHSHLA